MLELAHRLAVTPPRRLAVFPGAFNPPTRAHLAMAEAALSAADEVLFVLPREFPHKAFEGPGFDERVAMISAVAARDPRFSVGGTPRGLFIEIAEACRAVFGDATKLLFLCGSDAAER
ncbi:MAG: hypothetical protein IPM24_10010, partial [Bryobacterales bacterium]|nr:hypothetical protein [Bryobacterales bacterium]